MRISVNERVRTAMGDLALRRGHKWGKRSNRSRLVAELVEEAARKDGVWTEKRA